MIDSPRIARGYAAGFRLGGPNKVLQYQVVGAVTPGSPEEMDVAFGDAFGAWCLYAPPEAPDTDPRGTVTAACEVFAAEEGDAPTVLGSRDIRVARYAQDAKGGEVALVNAKGFRLFLGKENVSLVGGGAFLNLDIAKKTLTLTGFPSSPTSGAPYLSADTAAIGLVSATGAASISVAEGQVTASGSSISLDAGTVHLGKGASDPVVTYSQLMSVVTQILAALNAHMLASPAAGHTGSMPPAVVIAVPGTRVMAPPL
jgi:hypothetical protein